MRDCLPRVGPHRREGTSSRLLEIVPATPRPPAAWPQARNFTSQDTELPVGGTAVTGNGYDDPLDNLELSGNGSCDGRAKPKLEP